MQYYYYYFSSIICFILIFLLLCFRFAFFPPNFTCCNRGCNGKVDSNQVVADKYNTN